jgi:hypothetical protein
MTSLLARDVGQAERSERAARLAARHAAALRPLLALPALRTFRFFLDCAESVDAWLLLLLSMLRRSCRRGGAAGVGPARGGAAPARGGRGGALP